MVAMTDLHTGNDVQLCRIPDNMSVARFMLDYQHETRPPLDQDVPCLIDSKTGKNLNITQVSYMNEDPDRLFHPTHIRVSY